MGGDGAANMAMTNAERERIAEQEKTDQRQLEKMENFLEKTKQAIELVVFFSNFGLQKLFWMLDEVNRQQLGKLRFCDLLMERELTENLVCAIFKSVFQNSHQKTPQDSLIFKKNFSMFFTRFDTIFVYAES